MQEGVRVCTCVCVDLIAVSAAPGPHWVGGRYVVRGYGSVVIPTVPGRHVRDVHTFAPAASSKLQEIAAYLRGDYPQFYDAKFVARSEGREGT